MGRKLSTVAAVLVLTFTAGVLLAPQAVAKGEHVTFDNIGDRKVFVLASFGGNKCGEMSERVNFELEPGAEHVVESGDSRVCYCVGMRSKVASCGEGAWKVARAGKTERLNY